MRDARLHDDIRLHAPDNLLHRDEIAVLTDWRAQLVKHQKQAVIGAAVAGFVIGGGIAAVGGLLRRKR